MWHEGRKMTDTFWKYKNKNTGEIVYGNEVIKQDGKWYRKLIDNRLIPYPSDEWVFVGFSEIGEFIKNNVEN